MFAGLKFLPRDQIYKKQDEKPLDALKRRKKSRNNKSRSRRKKKSKYSSSGDELERIRRGSKNKQERKYSDSYSSSYSVETDNGYSSDHDSKKCLKKKKEKRCEVDKLKDVVGKSSKKRSQCSKKHTSSGSEDSRAHDCRSAVEQGMTDDAGSLTFNEKEIARRELGLEWMLRPKEKTNRKPSTIIEQQGDEQLAEKVVKANLKELNSHLMDNENVYPNDADGTNAGGEQLSSSLRVGDGGASWRLKALKRAQEQAAREGQKLDEIVGDRWGSLSQLTVSVASGNASPSYAHLRAIKNRKRGLTEENQTVRDDQNQHEKRKADLGRDYLKDISARYPHMKAPKVHESLSWGKWKSHNVSKENAGSISTSVSSLNKYSDDGSFLQNFISPPNDASACLLSSQCAEHESDRVAKLDPLGAIKLGESSKAVKPALTANQLAAKALQLRMRGKHEDAEKLMEEAEKIKDDQSTGNESIRLQNERCSRRYGMQDIRTRGKKDDDVDMHLARKIVQNKQYRVSAQADDEYDFDEDPSEKSRKKISANNSAVKERRNFVKSILTQQERCLFCFDNPNRPKHLVVSIANSTYLMLPQWQPVLPGHCCILPMQHESATRSVDNNVWEEIRNFKKCLIMMFAKQEKEMVFLETVMWLAQQRRHCLIECIPLPQEIAKQAPLYFKKAIDEAEDEWSQHNAKKLIDTSEKGLRGSIPKDFPYFHVEFGLKRGFVHVIDDEKQFKSSLGLNVIRGMLQLPEEDMHRRRRHESVESQKQAVASFAREWEPFDWTKQLD